jgi:hypothetical protein
MQTLDRRHQRQQENARDEAFEQASLALRKLLQPTAPDLKNFLASKQLQGAGKKNVGASKKPKTAAPAISQTEVRSLLRKERRPAAYVTIQLGHVSYVISDHD